MNVTVYDKGFFEAQQSGSEQSANVIVPLLLAKFPIRSVVDVGCGVGPWLRAFSNQGIADLTGLDGDYVNRADLLIPVDRFHATDLASDFSINRRYDLACSLEVAEHLPAAAGPEFVAKLCKAAPIVLFSAAIPGQGGTGHINEAWHDVWREYFASQGYRPLDLIRWKIWGHKQVEWWYQQNTIVYVDGSTLASHPDLQVVDQSISLNVVHPDCYAHQAEVSVSKAVKQLPNLLIKAAKRRLSFGR
jgi:hypothetical protein